jgi:hypothetical protein
MNLYINGDSHTAAAEAVVPHAFAEDDPDLFEFGRQPHPANFAVSWARQLGTLMGASKLHCDAESASSNARILRTTREWLSKNTPDLLIIQWSTWEREEWEYNGITYQVNGSGIDHVPPEAAERYRDYIIGLDWQQKTQQAHNDIWQLHLELKQRHIPHVFFNGNNNFSRVTNHQNWHANYIAPYDPSQTFDSILRQNGHEPQQNSWHFGKDAHSFFAQFMLQYCIDHQFF